MFLSQGFGTAKVSISRVVKYTRAAVGFFFRFARLTVSSSSGKDKFVCTNI